MIKLIATDMDGTLLDENGEMPKEFYKVFQDMVDKDIKFAVASGRQYHQLKYSFRELNHDIIYIAENGTIVMYEGEELYANVIDKSYVSEIIEDVKPIKEAYLVLCGKKSAYTTTDREDILKEMHRYYHELKVVEDLHKVEDDILKTAILDLRGSEDNINKILYPKWSDRLKVTVSSFEWLDIYNKDANKGEAVKLIQKKFNIEEIETAIFGDYFNDVEMLSAGYYSYAMENAPEGVKKHARFIAKSNKENGVLEKIKELI
ncbi:Cof-type HAD-IIB family hydrolase [Clostridium amazonitimonense]|uniref:Cof-type HAD-IIB family hydrolase n=1 Tax=Clostridium amazonitimonense TaxID=1499689 RepID=UPI000509ADDE|nr:Cof-type HAD-IIB family hydrolase [Clostridium amazonitimonense]